MVACTIAIIHKNITDIRMTAYINFDNSFLKLKLKIKKKNV